MTSQLLSRRLSRFDVPELGLSSWKDQISYDPFDKPGYFHKDKLDLNSPEWLDMMEMPSNNLLSPNPFAKSPIRDGFAVWDSVAVPCGIESTIMPGDKPQRLTNENPFMDVIERTFSTMVGANIHGNPVRPAGQFIFDLTRMKKGWLLAESAHALAHLWCDSLHDIDAYDIILQKTMCTAMAALLHGLTFGLPIYVGSEPRVGKSMLWPGVGISASDIAAPYMQVKKDGNGSMVPDGLCVNCLYLYHIEPVPEGYVTKTTKTGINDEWSGIPTSFVFAGWDGIDMLIHGRTKVSGKNEYHFMHAGDLLDPRMFPTASSGELYELAGTPPPDMPDWVKVLEWIGSDRWKKLISETPSLPCQHCYMINRNTPGAPKRPLVNSEELLQQYETERNSCIQITEKAANKAEIGFYQISGISRPSRKIRKRNNARRMKAMDKQTARFKKLARIRDKVSGKIKTRLTEKERELYESMKKEGLA